MDDEHKRKLRELARVRRAERQRDEEARHEAYHRAWQPGMPKYCYSELSERLVEALPELEDRYRVYVEAWSPDALGAYLAYGDVLQPYVIMLLDSGGPTESLERVFAFTEELASHPDAHVSTLCQLEVCEPIFGGRLLGQAWPLMGEESRKLCLNDVMWQPGPGSFKEDKHTAKDVQEYNTAWKSELEGLGGLSGVALPNIFELRKRLVAQYGLHHYWFRESYENWDLYTVVNEGEYRRRFKQELDRLGNPDDLYEWIAGLHDVRDRLFDELRLATTGTNTPKSAAEYHPARTS